MGGLQGCGSKDIRLATRGAGDADGDRDSRGLQPCHHPPKKEQGWGDQDAHET